MRHKEKSLYVNADQTIRWNGNILKNISSTFSVRGDGGIHFIKSDLHITMNDSQYGGYIHAYLWEIAERELHVEMHIHVIDIAAHRGRKVFG